VGKGWVNGAFIRWRLKVSEDVALLQTLTGCKEKDENPNRTMVETKHSRTEREARTALLTILLRHREPIR